MFYKKSADANKIMKNYSKGKDISFAYLVCYVYNKYNSYREDLIILHPVMVILFSVVESLSEPLYSV